MDVFFKTVSNYTYQSRYGICISITYVAFCMAFIAAAPVLKASTVSVVAFAPSSIIIYKENTGTTYKEPHQS